MSATATLHPAVEAQREAIARAVAALRDKGVATPRVAMILGSGLGPLADEVEDAIVIPYGEIPGFPESTAPGHAGRLVAGRLSGQDVVMMQGRFHTYEGYSQAQVAFPVRVFAALGVRELVVTCATGGLNRSFSAGDIMVITDHLNLTGGNPLIGPNDSELGPRFPVMFEAYEPMLRAKAVMAALSLGFALQEGVYAGITGPAYFTRAELRYLQTIGADAIGMSTVPEVITAIHAGLKVLGLGLISDMALPDAHHHATEQDVLDTVAATADRMKQLVRTLLASLD
ncbi:MAG: purine-nucleoside phosphorylase [Candidatus Sericytochromatia bacterium]|nr:purine-nucleoside phosphorylase [Candidatus Sericytochromatia bacterium]